MESSSKTPILVEIALFFKETFWKLSKIIREQRKLLVFFSKRILKRALLSEKLDLKKIQTKNDSRNFIGIYWKEESRKKREKEKKEWKLNKKKVKKSAVLRIINCKNPIKKIRNSK